MIRYTQIIESDFATNAQISFSQQNKGEWLYAFRVGHEIEGRRDILPDLKACSDADECGEAKISIHNHVLDNATTFSDPSLLGRVDRAPAS